MYNTRKVAEMIFDRLKNNLNLTDREKQDAIINISDLLHEEHTKALSLLGVSGSIRVKTLHDVGSITGDVDVCELCRYKGECSSVEGVYEKCVTELKSGEYYR